MLASRIRLQNRLFTLIEQQYKKHFGNCILQDFDQQVESQFRQALSSRSVNFQEAILSKLGKTRIIRDFIKSLKENKEFLQSIETTEEKQIHSIPQKSIILGKNTNFIFSFPLRSDLQWSLNTIVNQTGSFEKEYIQKIISQSNNFIDFIQTIDDYFLDYCIRKLDVTQIVSAFNRFSLDAKIKNQGLKEILEELACIDFIRLYALFYVEKEYFGYILSKLGLPLPILFTSKLAKQKKQYYLPQLLSSITRQNNYCLITSIGSSKCKNKGKTTFLQKLFLLKKKSLSSSASNFHQGSVDFYANIPLSIMDKDIIVADFHGNFSQNPKYLELLRKCVEQSSVVFINANENEINTQHFQKSSLLSEINSFRQCMNPEALNFIILRDSQRYDDVINGKIDIFQIIKLPNIEDPRKQPVLQSKCEYIFEMIKNHNYTAQKLKMSAFYNELALQKFLNDEGYVQKVMKILLSTFKNNNHGFYATLFPNLQRQLKMQTIKQKLTTIELKLKINIQQQSRTLLIQYNKTLEEYDILQKQKIPELSEMSLSAIGILQQDFKRIYLLSDVLFKWKEKETDAISKMIINKNAEYANLNGVSGKSQQKQILKEIIKNAQVALEKYDISVDTIFSQLISSLENRELLNNENQAKLIHKYYEQSYRNLNPINLIEGKTLSFGNFFLQQFMKQLQKTKYSNRQVFVVSVIGAQSSAKSTILNYLFRCNFATSVGRCTKGVYFTIVQCGQKVIVVIDTQGLLSVAARDHAFDVQIASFVMLISDLVIINNKGEVNSVLRDLLGVCIYAIDQLNSTQQTVDYQPNKVIFTIRDQVEYGGTKQHQMLGAIIKNLNEQSKVDFTKYIKFTQRDIYPLQSAFVSINEGNICYKSANNSFGKSIIALRARILSILQKPKNQSLTQFYSNAKRRWLSIKNCGENIFNFKNIYQIKTTQLIKEIFQKLKKQVRISFLEKYTLILEAFKVENIVQKENQIRQSLKNNFFRFKKETIEIFNSRCDEKVSEKELIKKFHFQIQQFCTLLYSDSVQKFNRLLQQKRFEKENINFRKNISKALKQSNANGKTDEQIINEYHLQHRNMIQKISNQLNILESKQRHMGRNQISLIINNKIQQFLRSYYYANHINYMNLQMLKKQYMVIQRLRADKTFSLVQYFIIKGKTGKQTDLMHSDKQMMVLLVNNFLKSSEETINRIITQDFKANLEEMDSAIIKIIEEIDDSYNQLGSNLEKIGRNFEIKRKHKGAVITRFISILPLKFETAYFKITKTKLEYTLKKQGQQLSSLIKDLELSLSIKGNNLQISKDWLKRIIERELERYLAFELINIQKELEQVCLFLNPTDIIQMAMSSLNNSQVRSKSRWIQCFKLVKNTNRYLKEFLYERSQFKNIQAKLTKVQSSITTKIQTFLKDKIVKEVQPIIEEGEQMTQKENFEESTKIDYYQKQFGIDLIAYKKDEFQQGITGIIMCISDLLSEINQKGKFYEELNEHIIVKMKSKMFKMRQNIKSFIKTIIEPQVIGCPERCPFCGIKCCKKGGHSDEHAALKETHLLQCFSGKVMHENGVCSRDICFTESAIHSGKVYVPQTETIIPVLNYIQDKYTRWYDHFLDKSQYSNKRRERQCNVIWANIQYVTIRYKYPYMIPDNSVKKYQYDPLQQEDIQAHKLEDY